MSRGRFSDEAAEPDRKVGGPDPRPLADALARLTSQGAWRVRLEGAAIFGSWEEIAGDQLARHTEPVRLFRGVLVVRAASPAWATQLRFLAGEIAARANAVLGPGAVTDVRVVAGRLQGTAGSPD